MTRGTFSLATLLIFVTTCGIFAGLIPLFVRPDHTVFVATWGGLVALQFLGAAHIRTESVSENAQRTRRQAMARVALQITVVAGLVPCLLLLLTLATEVAGPGAITEALELVAFPFVLLAPLAALAILVAVVLQTIGNFNLAAIATQAASFCSAIWPFVCFWILGHNHV